MSGIAELYAINDLDFINQEAGWQAEYRQLSPAPFQARFWFGKSSIFDITKELLTGSLEVMAADQDDAVSLLVRLPSSGEIRFNGNPMDCGDTFMLLPGAEIQAHVKTNTNVGTFRIPLSRIADIASAYDLEWRGFISGSSRKLRLHQEAVDGFTRALDAMLSGASEERMSSGARLDQTVELFVRSLLAPIDNQTLQKQRPRLGSRRNFQNALEFIEANLDKPFKITDVCKHACVGIRTLERHFVRETGLPPSSYIKARRLNAARRSLLKADPNSTSVMEIAHQHGISHLSRFSTEYRHFFGESPSKTLLNPT